MEAAFLFKLVKRLDIGQRRQNQRPYSFLD
jgi:hypothetical protein